MTLAQRESQRLAALEKTIEAGKQTFVEVGAALAEIRDFKLYRSDFKTFEDYCREKWGWNRAHCNQLIAGADAVKSLPPEMATIVSNQGQARELARVEPDKRAEVLERAAEAGPVTASSIREAASSWNYEDDSAPEVSDSGESDALFQLKRTWKKAAKKDRKEFLKWTKTNQ